MRFSTLAQWLSWQETLHPDKIDMGLERVRDVADIMGLHHPAPVTVTVAGTNGKGSSVAFLAAILRGAGYRVGTYTSPHVFRYNERVVIDGRPVADDLLCDAFTRIDAARGNTSLTYFEFGTLAALEVFHNSRLDVAVLEAGLGGRLDAVNVVDSDCALITRVGIDHVAWLGEDREQIGAEKAAIFRSNRPAVCGDPTPPASLLAVAKEIEARLFVRRKDFDVVLREGGWDWQGAQSWWPALPRPALPGSFQIDNAAAVLMTLECLRDLLPVSRDAVEAGLQSASVPGRLQICEGPVQRIFDVAHNPQAAAAVADYLAAHFRKGKTRVVLGMLADKDVAGVFAALKDQADEWYIGTVQDERGLAARELAHRAGLDAVCFDSLPAAYQQALADARPGDRILVTGSFVGVAQVLASLQ